MIKQNAVDLEPQYSELIKRENYIFRSHLLVVNEHTTPVSKQVEPMIF